MKKLFISVPMRNRTEYAIKASMEQMHKIAEAVFGEELEVIPTYFEDDPPENTNMALWYLGESIKKLSEADRFIGIYDEDKSYRGCIIENLAAKNYNIPSYLVEVGDVIAVSEKSSSNNRFKKMKEDDAFVAAPKWLDRDKNTLTGKVIALPARDDIDFEIAENLIVELYSK